MVSLKNECFFSTTTYLLAPRSKTTHPSQIIFIFCIYRAFSFDYTNLIERMKVIFRKISGILRENVINRYDIIVFMAKKKNYILSVAGIIGTITGITIAIPSFLNNRILLGVVSVLLIVGGLVLLAIAFGDD